MWILFSQSHPSLFPWLQMPAFTCRLSEALGAKRGLLLHHCAEMQHGEAWNWHWLLCLLTWMSTVGLDGDVVPLRFSLSSLGWHCVHIKAVVCWMFLQHDWNPFRWAQCWVSAYCSCKMPRKAVLVLYWMVNGQMSTVMLATGLYQIQFSDFPNLLLIWGFSLKPISLVIKEWQCLGK